MSSQLAHTDVPPLPAFEGAGACDAMNSADDMISLSRAAACSTVANVSGGMFLSILTCLRFASSSARPRRREPRLHMT